MIYADTPLCFGTKEYNAVSPICRRCGCFKRCGYVRTDRWSFNKSQFD